jgi:hypothetical protein
MSRVRQLLRAMLVTTVLGAALSGPAIASTGQVTWFEAPRLLLTPSTRPSTIATLQRLGVSALRVELSWHDVAPGAGSVHKPSFDPTNPAAYHWGQYDALIEEAHRLGWKVLLTVTSPVPRWATAEPRHDNLVTRPSSLQFERFMTAVGRHYGAEVQLFSIWNEPNHHEFLAPQFNRNGSPASPRLYRSLYQAGYAGLQAAGIASPAVLMGETAPEGEASVRTPVGAHAGYNMSPLLFLRDTLCLSSSWHRAGSCGKLATAGWGVHPYPNAIGPLRQPRNPETISIATLYKLTAALDRAARAGAVPSHLPVYITEYGIMSKPNIYQGVPAVEQAEWDAISERIAYLNPRVASFSQYLLKDDPIRRRSVGFQTGLEYATGRQKPLFKGFAMPLVVFRHGGSYSMWGLVRPAQEATTLTVEAQRPGSHRFTKLTQVQTDSRGYWTQSSSTAAVRWRVRWVSPQGVTYTGPSIGSR